MIKDKKEIINEVLDGIDERYVTEALEVRRKRGILPKTAVIAACATLAVVTTTAILPAMNKSSFPAVTVTEAVTEGVTEITGTTAEENAKLPETLSPVRPYKEGRISSSEMAYIWTWEAMTDAERYRDFTMNGIVYTTRGCNIGSEKLGDELGVYEFSGYDVHTDNTYTEYFSVYNIAGVSAEHLVAAELGGVYTVFRNDSDPKPQTLGELMYAFSLPELLHLKTFSEHNDYDGGGYFTIDDGSVIWNILNECKNAPIKEEDTIVFSGREVLSFTATSEELGIYKKAFSITRDGYLSTNIAEYGCVFFIGESASERIFNYVKNNSTEAEAEPYNYSVGGVVTELGDTYVLIDDTCICENEADGLVFKLDTTDPAVKRYVSHNIVKEGAFLYVTHRGKLVFDGAWQISDIVSISEAILTEDGCIITLE